jgi:hypothetical protein
VHRSATAKVEYLKISPSTMLALQSVDQPIIAMNTVARPAAIHHPSARYTSPTPALIMNAAKRMSSAPRRRSRSGTITSREKNNNEMPI